MAVSPFSSLIGHQRAARVLETLCRKGTLPSAVLLTGPDGIGKRTIAEHCAAALLAHPVETLHAHPDFLRVTLEERAGARDVLQSLLSTAHARPLTGAYRILLVEDLDRASAAAHALFLKTLEDAPATTRIFLTAQYRFRLPATVRSRVLARALAPLSDAELNAGLHARGLSAPAIATILPLAGGRPGLALRFLADPDLLSLYQQWEQVLAARALPTVRDVQEAELLLTFLASRLRRAPSAASIRRVRDGIAMLRQSVPVEVVVEYVGAS